MTRKLFPSHDNRREDIVNMAEAQYEQLKLERTKELNEDDR